MCSDRKFSLDKIAFIIELLFFEEVACTALNNGEVYNRQL